MTPPHLDRPVFVNGMGRSGTTLLRALLSAHPRLTGPPETHYLRHVDRLGAGRDAPASFSAFWDDYAQTANFRGMALDPEDVLRRLDGDAPSFAGIFTAILTAFIEREGAARVVEKTPGHVHFLDRLLSWYPDARVLVMRRDPRAVVASQLRSPWVTDGSGRPSLRRGLLTRRRSAHLVRFVEEWRTTYRDVVPPWLGDRRVRLVSYEALVRDPEAVLREICAFIDEPYEPRMLSGRSEESVPVPAVEAGSEAWGRWRERHYAASMGPVDASGIDSWRERLTALEVAAVERRCGQPMRSAGYEPVSSAPERAAAALLYGGFGGAAALEGALREIVRHAVSRVRA